MTACQSHGQYLQRLSLQGPEEGAVCALLRGSGPHCQKEKLEKPVGVSVLPNIKLRGPDWGTDEICHLYLKKNHQGQT